ncbi:MAG: tetratricopeptide repeat protein [Caldilineaceae bacterium]
MKAIQPPTSQLAACTTELDFALSAAQLAAAVTENGRSVPSDPWEKLLAHFPQWLQDANPHLLYVRGVIHMQQGALEQAITLLQRAFLLYQHQQDANGAANCALGLITIHLRREDFQTAQLHVQEIETLLVRMDDETVQTHLYLRLAELCPDIGRVAASITFAQQALHIARRRGHLAEQFKALLLLAILQRSVGQYEQSAAHLTLARQVQQAGALEDAGYLSILNAEAHLAWYRGDLSTAITVAQQLQQRVTQDAPDKRLLYCLTLLGNLHRAQGDFAQALHCYGEAREVAHKLGQTLYAPWLDAHEGWLYTLAGDYGAAQHALHKALESADRGQIMSFTVNLGLLYLLQGRTAAAQPLLAASLAFYQQSGDALAGAVIRFYLSWLYTQNGDPATANNHLTAALGWFAQQNIPYFPLWHHPWLVTQVCAWAITHEIHTALAERMVSRHIGSAALPWLEEIVQRTAPPQAVHLQPLLEQLRQHDDSWLQLLQRVTDLPARQVLQELLAANQLQRQNFPRLLQRLTTATQRTKPNPVLAAVFGLYLQGEGQHEIAQRLQRSPATIRNYITMIYQIFALPPEQFQGLKARKKQLRQAAEEEGFV